MSVWVEIPALYLDLVEELTTSDILIVNTIPEENSVDAPVDSDVVFELMSTTGTNVDNGETKVWINGVLAYDATAGGFQSGFTGSVVGGGAASDYLYTINPGTDFTSEQLVTVRVVGETVGGADTVDYSYTFTTEDTVKPQLVSVQALWANIIRVTFSEGMLAVSTTGTNDALNPSNYSFAFVPATDRQAGVSVSPTVVQQVSSTVYDITTDMELTFSKTYQVTCGNIADDSVNANTLEVGYRSMEFASWIPPNWPARRRFDLWENLSDDDRDGDIDGDLERIISAKQDTVDIMLWDSDQIETWWDIDRAPESYVDAMLDDMGNPFRFDLTLNKKRKLLVVLVDIYKSKGTATGIINVVRFFMGIEITEITEWNLEGWILGESELGVDTFLGPGDSASLYTFVVNVDQTLTTEQERQLTQLIDYMKPVHTHFVIVQPADPEFIDHLELGLSELGENWIIHE